MQIQPSGEESHLVGQDILPFAQRDGDNVQERQEAQQNGHTDDQHDDTIGNPETRLFFEYSG
ncbi:hypothetical protein D3C76_1560260 [compost metagenome]